MLAILDKIAYLYERKYKIRNCIKYEHVNYFA